MADNYDTTSTTVNQIPNIRLCCDIQVLKKEVAWDNDTIYKYTGKGVVLKHDNQLYVLSCLYCIKDADKITICSNENIKVETVVTSIEFDLALLKITNIKVGGGDNLLDENVINSYIVSLDNFAPLVNCDGYVYFNNMVYKCLYEHVIMMNIGMWVPDIPNVLYKIDKTFELSDMIINSKKVVNNDGSVDINGMCGSVLVSAMDNDKDVNILGIITKQDTEHGEFIITVPSFVVLRFLREYFTAGKFAMCSIMYKFVSVDSSSLKMYKISDMYNMSYKLQNTKSLHIGDCICGIGDLMFNNIEPDDKYPDDGQQYDVLVPELNNKYVSFQTYIALTFVEDDTIPLVVMKNNEIKKYVIKAKPYLKYCYVPPMVSNTDYVEYGGLVFTTLTEYLIRQHLNDEYRFDYVMKHLFDEPATLNGENIIIIADISPTCNMNVREFYTQMHIPLLRRTLKIQDGWSRKKKLVKEQTFYIVEKIGNTRITSLDKLYQKIKEYENKSNNQFTMTLCVSEKEIHKLTFTGGVLSNPIIS